MARRIWLVLGLVVVAAAVLVAYKLNSPTRGIVQAPHAGDPACGRLARGYPATLGGQKLAGGGPPGVAVWGDRAVVLRCGVQPPLPTTDLCVTVDGVDWVYREAASGNGRKVAVTYGRSPAVEATISTQDTAVDSVLAQLSRLVHPIYQQHRCLGASQ